MIRRTPRLHLHLCLGLAGLLAVLAAAVAPACATPQEDECEQAADALKTLLARPAMNTIPREKAVLRLRDLKAARQLERFLDMPQVSRTVVWALTEVGDPGSVKPVLRALDGMTAADRTHLGFFAASFATPEVRAWLQALDRDATTTNRHQKARVRAARLRAGDEQFLKATLTDLKASDPDVCACALLALGDSQRPKMLEHIAALAADRRPLKAPARSVFAIKKREQLANGGVRFTEERPLLETVAEAAIEAANRALRPTTMEQIAWWYELEKGPRFGRDASGTERLGRYLDAERRAAGARCCSADAALRRMFVQLRAAKGWGEDGVREVDDLDATFDKQWQISCRVNQQTRIRATIDRKGCVVITREE